MYFCFRNKELLYLNKFFNYSLPGIPSKCTITSGHRYLLKTDILEKEHDNLVLNSVYSHLISDWQEMRHLLKLSSNELILWNESKIITIEQSHSETMIGYFMFEPLEFRNYLIKHLNINFEQKLTSDNSFALCEKLKDTKQMPTSIKNVNENLYARFLNNMQITDQICTYTLINLETKDSAQIFVHKTHTANSFIKHVYKNNQYVQTSMGIVNSVELLKHLQSI
jgi:hypothetical protein